MKEIFLCEGCLSLRRRSFSAKDIFLCEGNLSLRKISFSAKEIFLCEGDLSLLFAVLRYKMRFQAVF